MVNGKPMKKWVEEYAVFEFDENGKMIISESLESDEKYGDYDENGNRRCMPNPNANNKARYLNPKFFIEKKGRITYKFAYSYGCFV